jgi:hypothetical protein
MLMTIGLCLLLFGEGDADQVARKVEKDLKSAKYLKVSYSTEGGTLQEAMLITDPEEVRSVTAAIGVEETQEGLQAGLVPMCRVVFILPDGKMMETNLAGFKSLDQSFWGQIYLRDDTFYKKLCEVASKHAGRPIDVLKGNTKPREPRRP